MSWSTMLDNLSRNTTLREPQVERENEPDTAEKPVDEAPQSPQDESPDEG